MKLRLRVTIETQLPAEEKFVIEMESAEDYNKVKSDYKMKFVTACESEKEQTFVVHTGARDHHFLFVSRIINYFTKKVQNGRDINELLPNTWNHLATTVDHLDSSGGNFTD